MLAARPTRPSQRSWAGARSGSPTIASPVAAAIIRWASAKWTAGISAGTSGRVRPEHVDRGRRPGPASRPPCRRATSRRTAITVVWSRDETRSRRPATCTRPGGGRCRAARPGTPGPPRTRARRRRPSPACRTAGSAPGRRGRRSSRPANTLAPLSVADADQLRRLDLDEAAARRASPGSRRPTRRRCGRRARRRGWRSASGRVVEQRGQLRVQRRPAQLERHRRRRRGQDADVGVVQLQAARRLVGRCDRALDLDHGLGQAGRRAGLAGRRPRPRPARCPRRRGPARTPPGRAGAGGAATRRRAPGGRRGRPGLR